MFLHLLSSAKLIIDHPSESFIFVLRLINKIKTADPLLDRQLTNKQTITFTTTIRFEPHFPSTHRVTSLKLPRVSLSQPYSGPTAFRRHYFIIFERLIWLHQPIVESKQKTIKGPFEHSSSHSHLNTSLFLILSRYLSDFNASILYFLKQLDFWTLTAK